MNSKQRPMSPFMIGPYYKPQLTSMLSIGHRITGVVLGLIGAPLLLWWLLAAGSGPESYASFTACMGSLLGRAALLLCLFSLCFHFFNGIRHLVWDTGHWLELKSAYASGWFVLVASVLCTAVLVLLISGGGA